MTGLLSGGAGHKIRASCDRCQGSKVKCSGTKPACWRCSQSSQTCVYSPFRRIGRPPKAAGTLGSANTSRDRQATRKSKRPLPPLETRCSPPPVCEDKDGEGRHFDEQHADLCSIINGLVESVNGTAVSTNPREDGVKAGSYPTSSATDSSPDLPLSMLVPEGHFSMEPTVLNSVELVFEGEPLTGMDLSEELFADMDMDLNLDNPLSFPEQNITVSPSGISWPPVDTGREIVPSPHYSFWYSRSGISYPLQQNPSLSNLCSAGIVRVQASAGDLSTTTTATLQSPHSSLDRTPNSTTVTPEQEVQWQHTDLHQQYVSTIEKGLINDDTTSEIQMTANNSSTTTTAATAPASCRNAKHSHHHQERKDCHAALAEQLGRLGACDVESADMSLDTLLSLHARLQHLKKSALGCPRCTARSSSRAILLMMVMALNNLIGILGKGQQQRQEQQQQQQQKQETGRQCGAIGCCVDDSTASLPAGEGEQERGQTKDNGGGVSLIGHSGSETLGCAPDEGFSINTPSTTSDSISGSGSGTSTTSSTRDMLSFLRTDKPLTVGGFVIHDDEVKQTFLRRLLVLHLERLAETMAALEREVESTLRGVDYNVAKEMLRDMRKRAFFLRGRLALAG